MKTTRKESPGFAALSLLLPCLLLDLFAGCTHDRPTASALQSLQGTWEGFEMGRETPTGPYVKSDPSTKITITITGNSLHFIKSADFWFETTIALPAGTDPQQLHATIKRPEESVGEVVIALFKIEGGTLILGGVRDKDSTAEWPKTFEASKDTMTGRYELQKVQPQKKRAGG